MKKTLFTLLLITSFFTPVFSQIYHQVNNPGSPGGNCFCLSGATVTAEKTAIWEENGYDLSTFQSGSFSKTYEVNLGNDLSTNGGHGIAFVIQQEGPIAIGSNGSTLGYGGSSKIVPSVAIEIDTKRNAHDGVPTGEDHLSAHLNGENEVDAPGTSPVKLPEMETGLNYELVINWTYDVGTPANSTLTATLRGKSISVQFDPATLFNNIDQIYIGFTGSVIGSVKNEQSASMVAAANPNSCSSVNGTFPVEWLNLDAIANADRSVTIEWATGSELNNDYFEVMRSIDGLLWEAIGVMDGNGTTEDISSYEFTDERPLLGNNFYRIRQIDLDGNFDFSPIVEAVAALEASFQVKAFPNPAVDRLNIKLSGLDENVTTQIVLLDGMGRTVLSETVRPTGLSHNTISMDVSRLPAGMYIVQGVSNKLRSIDTIVIQK